MKELTHKQERVLAFVEDYWERYGISPSFKEIQDHFGFKSPHAVTKHLTALERKGLVAQQRVSGFTKARSICSLRRRNGEVPLVGRIVAGMPVASEDHVESRLDLSFMGIDNSGGDYFALTVSGESMINAHIMDGDVVVVKRQLQVSGDEVAAVLWNGEATLKYVRKEGRLLRLVPANDHMAAIEVRPENTDRFQVLGRVVTVMRRLK